MNNPQNESSSERGPVPDIFADPETAIYRPPGFTLKDVGALRVDSSSFRKALGV